jgi:hypothetical protein
MDNGKFDETEKAKTKIKPKALNGRVCCVLDLPCCVPPPGVTREDAQVAILSRVIRDACPDVLSDGNSVSIATVILSHVDFVPKGVGKAIVDGYSKWLSTEEPKANTDSGNGK